MDAAESESAALSIISDSNIEAIAEVIACDRSNQENNVDVSVLNQRNVVGNPDLTVETESGVDSDSVSMSGVGESVLNNVLISLGKIFYLKRDNPSITGLKTKTLGDMQWSLVVLEMRAG